MLLTYIAEIYLIIISLCFTFAEPFDDIFDPRSDRPSEWIRARSLNSYFAFCKIVVKKSFTGREKEHLGI